MTSSNLECFNHYQTLQVALSLEVNSQYQFINEQEFF